MMRSRRLWWLIAVVLAALGVTRFGAAGAPPAAAKGEVYKSAGALAAQQQRDQQLVMKYGVLARGNPRMKVVALTFDDGPHPQYTPQLLAILRENNVKATFFVVGELAQKNPDLIRKERSQGNIVANHTYHHYNLTKIPASEVTTEWKLCQDVVQKILGETMRFGRPPGGDYNHQVVRAASQLGLTTVLWTDDPGDYANPGGKVIDTRLLRRVGNGGIILLHDGVQETVDILPEVIKQLHDRGFRFVTISELQAGLGNPQPRR